MTVGELVAVIERLVAGRGAAVHLRLVKGPELRPGPCPTIRGPAGAFGQSVHHAR